MDEELRKKFTQQKIKDLLSGNLKLLPTIICEMEDLLNLEIIRMNCLTTMKPFRLKDLNVVVERLDIQKGKTNWGELCIFLNIN